MCPWHWKKALKAFRSQGTNSVLHSRFYCKISKSGRHDIRCLNAHIALKFGRCLSNIAAKRFAKYQISWNILTTNPVPWRPWKILQKMCYVVILTQPSGSHKISQPEIMIWGPLRTHLSDKKGAFLPKPSCGLWVLSLPVSFCVSVLPSVCHRDCLCDYSSPFEARITKYGPEVQNNSVKIPVALGWQFTLTFKARL